MVPRAFLLTRFEPRLVARATRGASRHQSGPWMSGDVRRVLRGPVAGSCAIAGLEPDFGAASASGQVCCDRAGGRRAAVNRLRGVRGPRHGVTVVRRRRECGGRVPRGGHDQAAPSQEPEAIPRAVRARSAGAAARSRAAVRDGGSAGGAATVCRRSGEPRQATPVTTRAKMAAPDDHTAAAGVFDKLMHVRRSVAAAVLAELPAAERTSVHDSVIRLLQSAEQVLQHSNAAPGRTRPAAAGQTPSRRRGRNPSPHTRTP